MDWLGRRQLPTLTEAQIKDNLAPKLHMVVGSGPSGPPGENIGFVGPGPLVGYIDGKGGR